MIRMKLPQCALGTVFFTVEYYGWKTIRAFPFLGAGLSLAHKL